MHLRPNYWNEGVFLGRKASSKSQHMKTGADEIPICGSLTVPAAGAQGGPLPGPLIFKNPGVSFQSRGAFQMSAVLCYRYH